MNYILTAATAVSKEAGSMSEMLPKFGVIAQTMHFCEEKAHIFTLFHYSMHAAAIGSNVYFFFFA